MSDVKLDNEQFQKILGNCLEAWENVDRVEIILRGSEFEGISCDNVKSNVKIAKACIKEIHTTLFLIDDKEE